MRGGCEGNPHKKQDLAGRRCQPWERTRLPKFRLSGVRGGTKPGVSGAITQPRGRPPQAQGWGDDPCHPGVWVLPLPCPPPWGAQLPLPAAPLFTHRPPRLEQAQKLR